MNSEKTTHSLIRGLISSAIILTAHLGAFGQNLCNADGNLIIFANYDGGTLNIQVDVNIPNLRIGVCTYENCAIQITGPFAGNVTAVRYAGFQGVNDPCPASPASTTISGVAPGLTSVLFLPPAGVSDPNGYGDIVCGYSCNSSVNQGGCNTAAQILAYFTNTLGGTLRSYYTQYDCWESTPYLISSGGNCCPGQENAPVASFTPSDNQICPGDCITLANSSTGNPTTYAWSFPGGVPSSSDQMDPGTICFANTGESLIQLTVSGPNGSTSYEQIIQVGPCDIPGCMYPEASNYNPLATVDNGTCTFPPCSGMCNGDLDNNGFIGVGDLLIFISVFGSICP